MTETLASVEAKYAKQLMEQEHISEQEMNALSAMHRANVEQDNSRMESEAEHKKAWLDFFGKILAAGITGGIAAGVNYATRKDMRSMLGDVTKFEETGSYTSSAGKGLVHKLMDIYRLD